MNEDNQQRDLTMVFDDTIQVFHPNSTLVQAHGLKWNMHILWTCNVFRENRQYIWNK